MATEDFYRYRGAVGSLTRSRPADDPELVEARAAMAEETLVDVVAKALRKAPPLAPQARERVIALLDAHPVAQMSGGPDTQAYLQELEAYWEAAERGENDGKNPPYAAARDVAWEGARVRAKSIAALFDYQKTDVLLDFDAGPSQESPDRSRRAHPPAAGTRHPMSSQITAPCLAKEQRKVIADADEVARRRKKNKAARKARRTNRIRK